MKKIVISMVTLLLVFAITACSGVTDADNQENTTKNTVDTPSVVETTVTDETEFSEESVTEESVSENSTEAEDITEGQNSTTKKPVTTKKKTTKPSSNKHTTKKHTTTKDKTTKPTTTKPTTTKPKTTKPTTDAHSGKLPSYSPESELVDLFNKVNNYRAENGIGELTLDKNLCRIAYVRAQEQRKSKGHTRPDGTAYYTILDEYGYDYYGCGENIAFYNKVSADDIFEKWKGSSAHNQNMTEKRWTKSGIAMYINTDGTYSIVHLFAC